MRRQACTAGLDSRTRRSTNAPACRTTSASQECNSRSSSAKIGRSQQGVRSIAARTSRCCTGLSGSGRIGVERMIARNSNTMSERSSRAGRRLKQHFKVGFRFRCARRTVESGSRDTLGIITVPLRQRERLHIGVVSLKKTVCRRALNPVQKLRIIGAIRFARGCRACDHVVHSSNAGYHGLGRAASTIDRHHGGEPCSAQPPDRIYTEIRVLPHTSAYARLGEFHYYSGDAADEKRKWVLEHAPDTESGDTSAASPVGREKSTEDRSPGSNSARVAASKMPCNGEGRTIGVVTVPTLLSLYLLGASLSFRQLSFLIFFA